MSLAGWLGALPCVPQVALGSLVLVRPGDRVPLDGTVVQGSSAADEAMLTGAPLDRV